MSLFINENNLVLDYENAFYNAEESNDILNEVLQYNFEQATAIIRGKTCTPFRKVLAFADDSLEYHFSGTYVKGQAWTPSMLKIKKDVEEKTGLCFNYCLLNFYPNGKSSIGNHKDNEACLDPTMPIISLSFGAKRTLVFKRKGYEDFRLGMENGSLLQMIQPTNSFWSHGIAPEYDVNEARISLTFRNLIRKPKAKKRISFENDPKSETKKTKTSEDQLPSGDWLESIVKATILSEDNAETINIDNPISPCPPNTSKDVNFVKSWDLGEDTYVCLAEEKGVVEIHICICEKVEPKLIPTVAGVKMSPLTWFDFINKIHNCKLVYADTSFIANNKLLCTAGIFALTLQEFDTIIDLSSSTVRTLLSSNDDDNTDFSRTMKFTFPNTGHVFKPGFIHLFRDQICMLQTQSHRIKSEISDYLLKTLLPELFVNARKGTPSPYSTESPLFGTLEQNSFSSDDEDEEYECDNIEILTGLFKKEARAQIIHNCLNKIIAEKDLAVGKDLLQLFDMRKIAAELFTNDDFPDDFFTQLAPDYKKTLISALFEQHKD